ncbi:hypothetical protein [Streptomyces sp. NBC_00239]|uniref:hypothetical protein n=1 Tax=Streptomyces sp. NBC_00239 TaxID=2903640 RepID=UPI002E2884D5|nr:hypothetical protein [Streptomyces sp. NBC_00239]
MQIHGDDEARATGPDGRLTTEDLAHSGAADEPGSSGRAPAYPGEATSGPDAPAGPDDGTRAERDAETRDADEETEGTQAAGTEYAGTGTEGTEYERTGTDQAAVAPAGEDEDETLLGAREAEEYRRAWTEIQGRFVDDPQEAVRSADTLVAEVMQTLAGTFSEHKQGLEGQWDRGEQVATEDLRLALQHYRSFFNRLLRT